MYITRVLEGRILQYLEKPEILAIVGPRQCGKTTLLKKVSEDLQNCKMITFEDREVLTMFERNIDDFIEVYVKNNRYLVIDEFQYAKEGGRKLKYIFDTQKIKIIISGSSNIDLTVNALKFLVGRIFIFNLYPLDFHEFLTYKAKEYLDYYENFKKNFLNGREVKIGREVHQVLLKNYEEYLTYGGYPRVVTADNAEEKKEVLKNIYNTYFLREVRDILGLIDDYKLERLIKALSLQIGNIIEYKELSLISGYDYLSLKKYLNFLEKTFVCSFVKPFFRNKRTEIVKNPKVYFYDTGLRNVIVNDFRGFDSRPDIGGLLENGVFQQLVKLGIGVNYWRDKQQHEIDFVLGLEGGKQMAIEVKKSGRAGKMTALEIFKRNYPEIERVLVYMEKLDQLALKTWPIYGI